MPNQNQSFNQDYTEALAAPLIIVKGDNVIGFTLMVVTGTCTVQGSRNFRGVASTPITLAAGSVFTETASPSAVLDGFIITPIGGTTNLALKF